MEQTGRTDQTGRSLSDGGCGTILSTTSSVFTLGSVLDGGYGTILYVTSSISIFTLGSVSNGGCGTILSATCSLCLHLAHRGGVSIGGKGDGKLLKPCKPPSGIVVLMEVFRSFPILYCIGGRGGNVSNSSMLIGANWGSMLKPGRLSWLPTCDKSAIDGSRIASWFIEVILYEIDLDSWDSANTGESRADRALDSSGGGEESGRWWEGGGELVMCLRVVKEWEE
ncbi:hypothetical protein Tco_1224109, partial [Tanacetum coccineum]